MHRHLWGQACCATSTHKISKYSKSLAQTKPSDGAKAIDDTLDADNAAHAAYARVRAVT